MKTQKLLIGLAASSLLLFFNNCSSSKTGGSSSQASRSVPADLTDDDTSNSSAKISQCSILPQNTLGLGGSLETYIDPDTKDYYPDIIRFNLNSYPSSILNSSNYLQIFRWSEDTPEAPAINPTPVNIYFIQKNLGGYLQETPVTDISKGTIEKLIADHSLSDHGVNTSNFLQSVILVLEGMDLQYDAMKLVIYDYNPSGTDSVIGVADALLPPMEADPNLYSLTHSADSLRLLHPFWGIRNTLNTEDQYLTSLNSYCNPNN